jgi:hypothetical protein
MGIVGQGTNLAMQTGRMYAMNAVMQGMNGNSESAYVPQNLEQLTDEVNQINASGGKAKTLTYTDEQLANMPDYDTERVIANGMMQPDSQYANEFMERYANMRGSTPAMEIPEMTEQAQPAVTRKIKELSPMVDDGTMPTEDYDDVSAFTAEDFGLVTQDSYEQSSSDYDAVFSEDEPSPSGGRQPEEEVPVEEPTTQESVGFDEDLANKRGDMASSILKETEDEEEMSFGSKFI